MRPSSKRVAYRFLDAGSIILYDQHNPANNEIKQPGPDVNYRAEGPTTYAVEPDGRSGEPTGQHEPSNQTDNVPPASSRVIPDEMKNNLQDQLTYKSALLPEALTGEEGYQDTRLDPEGGEGSQVPGADKGETRSRTAALISEIMGRCGPDIVKRSSSLQFRRTRILPKHGMIIYAVQGSVEGQSDGKTYTVKVKGIRKGNVKALGKMQIKVSCSCPYFRWQGPEHWAKTNGYLYGRPVGTASKPVIKDPKDQHWVCKHAYAVLNAKKGLRFASEQPQYELSPLPDPARVATLFLRSRQR